MRRFAAEDEYGMRLAGGSQSRASPTGSKFVLVARMGGKIGFLAAAASETGAFGCAFDAAV
jgi:hypothetical protein